MSNLTIQEKKWLDNARTHKWELTGKHSMGYFQYKCTKCGRTQYAYSVSLTIESSLIDCAEELMKRALG